MGETSNKFITSPVILYRRVQKEGDDLSYTIARYGPQSVASANGLNSQFCVL